MDRNRTVWALAVFAVSVAAYALTACPTVYVGDSGDLITASYNLGVPHPSGYPLYMILGKAFFIELPQCQQQRPTDRDVRLGFKTPEEQPRSHSQRRGPVNDVGPYSRIVAMLQQPPNVVGLAQLQ